MLREASALCLAAYALVLLAGLVALWRGEPAWLAWRAALATPLSVALHALALPVVAYHALTWFQVLPKTLPTLPPAWTPRRITAAALALSAGLSLALLGLVWSLGR
jgi:fumarate reductase subunit C